MNELKNLLVFGDYESTGIWDRDNCNIRVAFKTLLDAGVPAEFVAEFENWLLLLRQPDKSVFDYEGFNNTGLGLAAKLREYLPAANIEYRSQTRHNLENPSLVWMTDPVTGEPARMLDPRPYIAPGPFDDYPSGAVKAKNLRLKQEVEKAAAENKKHRGGKTAKNAYAACRHSAETYAAAQEEEEEEEDEDDYEQDDYEEEEDDEGDEEDDEDAEDAED